MDRGQHEKGAARTRERTEKIKMRRLVSTLLISVAVIALAACGGDDAGGPDPDATVPVGGNAPGLLTPSPPPDIDPEMDLKKLTAQKPYTISYPPEWTVRESPGGMDLIDFSTAFKGQIAKIEIECLSSTAGARGLLEQEKTLLEGTRVPFSPGTVQTLTLDGRAAYLFPYSVNLGSPVSVIQNVFYIDPIEGESCSWKLRMVIFAIPPAPEFDRLFRRIAESFHSEIVERG